MRTVIVPLLLLATPALAETPAPAPELAALKPFARAWACKETVKDDQGKDVAVTAQWKLKQVAGGRWVSGTYEQKPSKVFPGSLGDLTFGWDGSAKKYVLQEFDNGGGRLLLTAAAPEAGKLVWTGEGHLGGHIVPARYTWTEKDGRPATATFVLELQVGKDWIKFTDGACKGK